MTISVVICTYNGSRYIKEQLESILCQTHHIDEIIVCDDCSSDDTMDIVRNFQIRSNIPIHTFQNASNIGYKQNFIHAISLCTCDIICLSDQDDVWKKDKIEIICKWFEEHKDSKVVFSDAQLINENGYIYTKETLWDKVGFTARMRNYFEHGYGQEIFTIVNRATGATMAIKRTFLEHKDLLSYNLPHHDYTIAYFAIVENCCGYIKEPLMSYRLHGGNTIGVGGYELCSYSPLRACTIEVQGIQNLPEEAMRRLSFMQKREQLYTKRFGVLHVIGCVRNYFHAYGAWWYKFFLYDLCRCFR